MSASLSSRLAGVLRVCWAEKACPQVIHRTRLAPLCNTLAKRAIRALMILPLGPVSGAQFNPAVPIAFAAAALQ